MVWARHVNHFQRSDKSAYAEVCLQIPLTPAPPPIPFNEELHRAAGFDHFIHGKDCEKHIYFGNTREHIYTYKYIFAHAFSLGCIYVYLLSRVSSDLQSVFQSVLLRAVNKTFPNLGSWQLDPTTIGNQTAGLWKAQPIHLGSPFFKGHWPPLETLSSKPLLALMCPKRLLRNQDYFENTWVVLITLSRPCLEWEQRLSDLWAWRVNESGKFSLTNVNEKNTGEIKN